MSRRATDVIGKPIVSADTGRRLGTVADLLLDDEGHGLTGVLVKNGMFRHEHVLPVEAVQSFGGDAVVTRSESMMDAREWHNRRDARPVESDPLSDPK
jgi:uncharacterized protein YrrD